MSGILKDPEKRAILSWLGGGAVVVAGGIWTVVTFVVGHGHDKKDAGAVILSGKGIGSGRDANIYGPSKHRIERIQKAADRARLGAPSPPLLIYVLIL